MNTEKKDGKVVLCYVHKDAEIHYEKKKKKKKRTRSRIEG
jgi:hypothetical protein